MIDPEDGLQEVELQRWLGRRVSTRIVRRRMEEEERRRAEAERGSAERERSARIEIDPVRFPLLFDRFVRRLPLTRLLQIHNCRSRSTLAKKIEAELERLRNEL